MKEEEYIPGADYIEFDPEAEVADKASYSIGTNILIWIATNILKSFFIIYLLGIASGYWVSVLANNLVS